MYLKRVETIGFKSFAHKVNIDFTAKINGIVGPNGCGKSNITDAIKWVLGEQSTKNLRASGMSDVIFAGSQDYKRQNFAEVTLVFDNSDSLLKVDFNEVEITRRLYRNGESEYLINKTHCRLKDIIDLILDTGLGKDSLSMISQGAISNFAQAKAIDRRLIFEEAAGVAKYKKRKIESLRKLERTNDNLIRISDIISELELQIEPLKIQAAKAKQYIEKKEKLEKIEVSVIVNEVNGLENNLNTLQKELNNINEELVLNDSNLLLNESKIDALKENLRKYDNEINILQNSLLENNDLILSIEKQKQEEENTFLNTSLEYLQTLKLKLDNVHSEVNSLTSNLKIVNDDVQKSIVEYDTFKENHQIKLSNLQVKQNNKNNLQSKREVLKNIIDNKSNVFVGVKAVIDAQNSLSGIVGMVGDLFEVEDTYQEAISKSLSASLQNVVVNTSNDAKKAVEFLKRNQAGRATFIPVDSIKVRVINENDLYVANQMSGFIDIATNLINYNEVNNKVFEYLLNTTLVCDSIANAISIAKALNNRYRIVTLDGDVISVGGLVTGGKIKNDRGNLLTSKKDLEKINDVITRLDIDIKSLQDDIYQDEQVIINYRNKINQQNISIAKIEENLSNKQYIFDNLKNEYQALTNEEYANETSENNLNSKLTEALLSKERILSDLKTNRETKIEINRDLDKIENDTKQIRISISNLKEEYNEKNIAKTKNEISLKSLLDRLAEEYSLTIDNAKSQVVELDMNIARKEVNVLKREIKNLGVINLLAIEEYEKVNERFEFLSNQKNDLEKAKTEILGMINSTDKIMIEKFSKTIDDINKELPLTFKKLFGGGQARLEYTDPNDLLETGIEIIANPPGKSVQNLTLFSGGEKALIALSVLFAILKARPIPLCILDEVEAALDQANVERFAKYLKDFSELTQFIVITHRPGTMEQCDVLYGVTMQEKGVTKMIGVHLEEAKDLANSEVSN